MLEDLQELPFWQGFLALFVIVMARSNATYWIGRGAIGGWRRRRPLPDSESRRRAERLINRWGPIAVALSYLTIGIQTTIHLTAGLLRMRLVAYLPGALVGSMMWAAIYATIGLAVFEAWLAAQAGSWYGLAGIAAIVLVGVTTWLLSRRRHRAPGGRDGPGVPHPERDPES